MFVRDYRVNKAVRARLLILVDLVDNQEHDTHQEGQGADHQQGHLKETQQLHHQHKTCVTALRSSRNENEWADWKEMI